MEKLRTISTKFRKKANEFFTDERRRKIRVTAHRALIAATTAAALWGLDALSKSI